MEVRPTSRALPSGIDHDRLGVGVDHQPEKVGLRRGAATTDAGPFGAHPATVAPRPPSSGARSTAVRPTFHSGSQARHRPGEQS